MKCKACGVDTLLTNGDGEAYCAFCMWRRRRNPPEIDRETGEWEGMEI